MQISVTVHVELNIFTFSHKIPALKSSKAGDETGRGKSNSCKMPGLTGMGSMQMSWIIALKAKDSSFREKKIKIQIQVVHKRLAKIKWREMKMKKWGGCHESRQSYQTNEMSSLKTLYAGRRWAFTFMARACVTKPWRPRRAPGVTVERRALVLPLAWSYTGIGIARLLGGYNTGPLSAKRSREGSEAKSAQRHGEVWRSTKSWTPATWKYIQNT